MLAIVTPVLVQQQAERRAAELASMQERISSTPPLHLCSVEDADPEGAAGQDRFVLLLLLWLLPSCHL